MKNKFKDLYKIGKDFKKSLGWSNLPNDEIRYEIIEAIKGKDIADKWLKHNKSQ